MVVLSHPFCGNLLWQPEETNATSQLLRKTFFLFRIFFFWPKISSVLLSVLHISKYAKTKRTVKESDLGVEEAWQSKRKPFKAH